MKNAQPAWANQLRAFGVTLTFVTGYPLAIVTLLYFGAQLLDINLNPWVFAGGVFFGFAYGIVSLRKWLAKEPSNE